MSPTTYGRAGWSLRNRTLRRVAIWTVPLLIAAVVAICLPFLPVPRWVLPFTTLALGALLVGLKRYERTAEAAVEPLIKGVQSEYVIEDVLADLPEDCIVIHDLDLGRGNVDHVVIAKSGVYSVETKGARGRVVVRDKVLTINGKDHSEYLRQAYAEAMAVRALLDRAGHGIRTHFVTPLIVFTHAEVDAQGRTWGVYVLGAERLLHFLEHEKERLNTQQRASIAAALRLKTTAPQPQRTAGRSAGTATPSP
jgi:hypothetical protein